MAYTTTTQIGGPIAVQFQVALLMVAKSQCPHFAGVSPAQVSSRSGTELVAKWRRISNMTPATTPLTELTGSESYPTRTATQLTITDLTATLAKYGDFILLSEEVDLENFSEMTMGYANALGIQAGRTLNILQRNEMEDNTTIYRSNAETADGSIDTALLESDVQYAVNWINRNDGLFFTDQTFGSDNYDTHPVEFAFKGICHPDVEEDIRSMTSFIPAAEYGAHTQLERFEFGKTGRVRWVSSSDVSIETGIGADVGSTGLRSTVGTAGNDVDIYNTLIYAQDAYGSVGLDTRHVKEVYVAGDNVPGIIVVNRTSGPQNTADPLDEQRTMGWKSWHAAKVLSELTGSSETKWCLNIRSGATKLGVAA